MSITDSHVVLDIMSKVHFLFFNFLAIFCLRNCIHKRLSIVNRHQKDVALDPYEPLNRGYSLTASFVAFTFLFTLVEVPCQDVTLAGAYVCLSSGFVESNACDFTILLI